MKKIFYIVLILALLTSCTTNNENEHSSSITDVVNFEQEENVTDKTPSIVNETINIEDTTMSNYIIGSWQLGGSAMGSGVGGCYIFNDNHTFSYYTTPFALEITEVERFKFSTGSWFVEEDRLFLSANSYRVIEGGEIVEDTIVGYSIEGGKSVLYEIEPEDRVLEVYQVEKLSDDGSASGTMIGKEKYYQIVLTDEKKEELNERYTT